MYNYKMIIKITNNDDVFFGNGPALLLELIDETKSISKAAKQMNMAYSKACRLIKLAETELKFKLIETKTGGIGGGGSVLTEKAILLLNAYREAEKKLDDEAHELFIKIILPTLD